MSVRKIQLHIDYFSQPSRAIVIFCDILNIPYELQVKNLVALDHKTKEFKQVNPILTLPAMHDPSNNISIGESHTIMKYLSERFQKYDLYPQDLKKRVKIDFFLDWHLGNLRAFMYPYLRGKYIFPLFDMKPSVNLDLVLKRDIAKSLKQLENAFLKENQYVAGDFLSIADISAYCEVTQFFNTEYNDVSLEKYPNIKNWIQRLSQMKEFQRLDKLRDEEIKNKGFDMKPKL